MRNNNIGAEGAKPLADALRVSGALTAANLRDNWLDGVSKQLLRDAVKDRSSFELKL